MKTTELLPLGLVNLMLCMPIPEVYIAIVNDWGKLSTTTWNTKAVTEICERISLAQD